MQKLNLIDVKTALLDPKFREGLPDSLLGDVQKFLSNPNCGCNHPIYKRVVKAAADRLAAYYPAKQIVEPDEPADDWTVINCHVDELQNRLRRLPPGQHQLDVARWQDQVTVVVKSAAVA